MKKICVYCGSSDQIAPSYLKLATSLGEKIAELNLELVYGGGSLGLMGRVADGALARGGTVTGIIPTFMKEREWAHLGLTQLIETADMSERKRKFIELADAFVVLPGGIGTFEELFETLSEKKLQSNDCPVFILNHGGYYDGLLQFLDHSIKEGFVGKEYKDMWTVVDDLNQLCKLLS